MKAMEWMNFARKKKQQEAQAGHHPGVISKLKAAPQGGKWEVRRGPEMKDLPKEYWTMEQDIDGKIYELTKIEYRRTEPPIYTWKPKGAQRNPIICETWEEAMALETKCRGIMRHHMAEYSSAAAAEKLGIARSNLGRRAQALGIMPIIHEGEKGMYWRAEDIEKMATIGRKKRKGTEEKCS